MSKNLLQMDIFEKSCVDLNPIYLELCETRESLSRVRKNLFAKISELSRDVAVLRLRLDMLERGDNISQPLYNTPVLSVVHTSRLCEDQSQPARASGRE